MKEAYTLKKISESKIVCKRCGRTGVVRKHGDDVLVFHVGRRGLQKIGRFVVREISSYCVGGA